MSTQQKSAWYSLMVGVLTVAAYVALLLLAGPSVAPAAFAVLALMAGTPWLFQDEVADERERHIARHASVAGGVAAYLFLVAVCMLVWWLRYRADPPTVDVNVLPLIAMGACVTLLVVRSLAVLLLHRRDLHLGEP
jgi:hypothetical protein